MALNAGKDIPVSTESVTFRAAFPPIQSAIKVYGDKQGMRVQLDIPESDMAAAMSLFLWRAQVLEVTVRPAADDRQKRAEPYL